MNKRILNKITKQIADLIQERTATGIEVSIFFGDSEARYAEPEFTGDFSEIPFSLKTYKFTCSVEPESESELLENITYYSNEIEEIFVSNVYAENNLIIRLDGCDIRLTFNDCFLEIDQVNGCVNTYSRHEYILYMDWIDQYFLQLAN